MLEKYKKELNIRIKVESFITETVFDYPTNRIHLLAYWAEWITGKINPRVHEEIKWVTIDELLTFTFAPADVPIVTMIVGDRT